jgi:periodic tryptophan protein 1
VKTVSNNECRGSVSCNTLAFSLCCLCLLEQIPHGASKRVPLRHDLTAEELAAQYGTKATVSASGKGGKLSKEALLADPAFASLRGVELPASWNFDNDDDDEDEAVGKGSKSSSSGKKGKSSSAAAIEEEEEEEDLDDDEDDDDDSDADDYVAKASDTFLLAANTEDEFSSLEVHCYNTEDGSLYVHHDITLPAFPIALAWMDYAGDASASNMLAQCPEVAAASGSAPSGYVGSYVAVGTFKPDIEIWNLDIIDPLEPALVLRGAAASASEKSKKKGKAGKKGTASASSNSASSSSSSSSGGPDSSSAGHSDAVLSLAWNRVHRHLLASGSADKTVKLWDLDGGGRLLHTFSELHVGRVQCVAWNPTEETILATSSEDRTLCVLDARAGPTATVARYALPSPSEAMQWNIHNSAGLLASCDDGTLLEYDCRMPDKALWSIKAHAQNTTGIAQSSLARGLMATCSLDKSVKIWDSHASSSGSSSSSSSSSGASVPVLVSSKSMAIGQVFSVSFFSHSPFLLAAGGSKGIVAIWDLTMDGGDVPIGVPPPTAADAAVTSLPPEATFTARRFATRLQDAASVPGIAVRPRPDGQLAGGE